MSATQDKRFMMEALHLAMRGGRAVSPNPMVGAVLVRSGRIVARGWHRSYGGAHAEVDCLSRYRGPLKDTTLYVTLEPCSHFGKTPPCAQLLATTPVRRIVVAMVDPNPLVAGCGIRILRKAGKRVDVGVMEDEARAVNRRFVRAVTEHRPYVYMKVAQTLDGRITEGPGGRRWITGPEARRVVHALRSDMDAVLVGAGTVRTDDPRLTVRGTDGQDPHVVVLDGMLSLRPDARLIRASRRRTVYVVTTTQALRTKRTRAAALARKGVQVIGIGGNGGRIPLLPVLRILYDEGIGALLVEGGADIFGQFLRSRCVDEMSVFIAPRVAPAGLPAYGADAVFGHVRDAVHMHTHEAGDDLWVHTLFD